MNEEKVTTKDILKIIAVSGIVLSSMIIPTTPIAVGAIYKSWKNYKRKDVGRIIKRLEKQEMISYKEKDGKIIFEITEKGKRRLLEYDFENLEIKKKKIDGKWRIVIFDIPEDKKVSRDAFRKKLLQMEFIRFQDSVFAICYPCKKEIDFLVHYLGISDFITLIKVDEIERGEKLIFKKYYSEE